jgi:hypothetical protein
MARKESIAGLSSQKMPEKEGEELSELIAAAHSTEQGHFYTQNGQPAYEIIGANGKQRPTTLRDAKKLNLVPSVTTILKCADKPGLQSWIIDQNIIAALSLPRVPDETDDQFIARVKLDAKEQSKKAAEKGTWIHAQVQGGFEGKVLDPEGMSYYESARKTIYEALQRAIFDCEKPFARYGYGGKVDLSQDGYVIDIKTNDKDLKDIKTWDEQHMQLAAYRMGLGLDDARCFILYINYRQESKLIEIPSNQLEKGWKCFMALRDYFYSKSGLELPPKLFLHEIPGVKQRSGNTGDL